MKRYVLCFALPLRVDPAQFVILIERTKKDWQEGRLNLPGGLIEEGETPEQAAIRELRQETGLVATDVQTVGKITGKGWEVVVVLCPYRPDQTPRTASDEGPIHHVPWPIAKSDERLHPNLRIIIPLCQSKVLGWVMEATEDEAAWTTSFPALMQHTHGV